MCRHQIFRNFQDIHHSSFFLTWPTERNWKFFFFDFPDVSIHRFLYFTFWKLLSFEAWELLFWVMKMIFLEIIFKGDFTKDCARLFLEDCFWHIPYPKLFLKEFSRRYFWLFPIQHWRLFLNSYNFYIRLFLNAPYQELIFEEHFPCSYFESIYSETVSKRVNLHEKTSQRELFLQIFFTNSSYI